MEVKVYVLIDASETYWVDTDPDAICGDDASSVVHPTRLLEITLEVPPPAAVELSAEVPADTVPTVPVKMTVK